jgi:putative DNA-invertase from lambdoid prophage Rac
VIADREVSGVGTMFRDRPQGRQLFDLLRWATCWSCAGLTDLGETTKPRAGEFMQKSVIICTVINGLKLTARRRINGEGRQGRDDRFYAAIAEAQEEVKKEAMSPGIEHAKQNELNYLGRQPSFTREQIDKVQELDASSKSVAQIAEATKL